MPVTAALFVFFFAAYLYGGRGLPLIGAIGAFAVVPYTILEAFWRGYERATSFYTLTNKRAFIGTAPLGRRRLTPYPINSDTELTVQRDANSLTVYFAYDIKYYRKHEIKILIGFSNLPKDSNVLRAFDEVQSKP